MPQAPCSIVLASLSQFFPICSINYPLVLFSFIWKAKVSSKVEGFVWSLLCQIIPLLINGKSRCSDFIYKDLYFLCRNQETPIITSFCYVLQRRCVVICCLISLRNTGLCLSCCLFGLAILFTV